MQRELISKKTDKFHEYHFTAPAGKDFDLVIIFPNGKEMTIQARPSNADVNYNGSLDVILPDDAPVTNWKGDDMFAAPAVRGHAHIRRAKQLVTELPYSPEDDG